jgi:hypothetical protein
VHVSAHPEWNSTFTDPDYYDKTYHVGPVTDWNKVETFVLNNPGALTLAAINPLAAQSTRPPTTLSSASQPVM